MKRLILFVLTFAYIMPSFAQSKGDGAPYRGDWGASNVSAEACDIQGAAMGLTQLVYKELTNKGILAGIMQKSYLGYVGQEYVAREINKYGAKFCKTIIAGDRKNCHHSPYTTYFEPEVQDCFWLCKAGYYGAECNSTSLTGVIPQIKIEQFLNKKTSGIGKLAPFGTSGDNIEDAVPMFIANQYVGCWDKYSGKTEYEDRYSRLITKEKQEHDVILVLKSIIGENKKLNFVVQPMIVRAGGSEKCSGNEAAWTAWPMMKFVGTGTYVCPSDYKQEKNSNGTLLCVDPEALERQEKDNLVNLQQDKLAHMCNGYLASLFDDAKHDLLVVDKTTLNILPRADQPEPGQTYNWESKKACTMYRCKNPSLAFKTGWASSDDASCYECSGDPMRYGVNDLGECQKCANGEIFDSGTKQCKVATVFTKSDMRFGKGKSPSSNLEDQCWIKDNPDCYKCCITNDDTSCSLCSDEE